MMKPNLQVLIAFALLLPTLGVAQMRLNATNPGGLLTDSTVQKELKLTATQLETIKQAQNDFRDFLLAAFSGKSGGGKQEDVQASLDAETIRLDAQILGSLTPEQNQRLKELDLQIGEPDAILKECYQADLKLTSDQKQAIKTVQETYRTRMSNLQQAGVQMLDEAEMNEMTKRGNKLRADASESISMLLSSQQNITLKCLKGKPVA